MTIKDLMKQNADFNGDVIIEYQLEPPCGAEVRRVYEGNLNGIPEELQGLEVIETAHSLATDKPVICIDKDEFKALKKKAK